MKQEVTVCAFIHHEIDGATKLLLAKRAATKKFLPGVFELPGGHVELGEDPIAALTREIKEEFDAEVKVSRPFYTFSYIDGNIQTIEIIYFARLVGHIDTLVLKPEEHSEIGWFAEHELVKATTPEKSLEDPEFQAARIGFSLLLQSKVS